MHACMGARCMQYYYYCCCCCWFKGANKCIIFHPRVTLMHRKNRMDNQSNAICMHACTMRAQCMPACMRARCMQALTGVFVCRSWVGVRGLPRGVEYDECCPPLEHPLLPHDDDSWTQFDGESHYDDHIVSILYNLTQINSILVNSTQFHSNQLRSDMSSSAQFS